MTVRPERSPSLGRGLAALIPQRPAGQAGPTEIPIDRIRPNPGQPRVRFDETELATLTASIREHGVLQPILVTETVDGYQLVAGERRWRAARAAGLERIPAMVRDLDEVHQLEIALIENLQREDLDPIESANGFRRLMDDFGLSQEQVATRVGKARSTVANTLRLLDLAPVVQAAVIDRSITEGHARALGGLSVEHQEHVVGSVIDQDLSVRQTEELVRRKREEAPAVRRRVLSHDLQDVEAQLRGVLATKVGIVRTRRGGRLVIDFYSDEELDRLYAIITRGATSSADVAVPVQPDHEVLPTT
jgi:ParB family chromosome partitioning protein